MEAPSSRKGVDRLGKHAASRERGILRRLKIADPDNRQRRRDRVIGSTVQTNIHLPAGGGRVIRAVVREVLSERLGVKGTGQLMSGEARQLDVIDPRGASLRLAHPQ